MAPPACNQSLRQLEAHGLVGWLKDNNLVSTPRILVALHSLDPETLGPLKPPHSPRPVICSQGIMRVLPRTFVGDVLDDLDTFDAALSLSLDLRPEALVALDKIELLCKTLQQSLSAIETRLEYALGLSRYGVTIAHELEKDSDPILQLFAQRALSAMDVTPTSSSSALDRAELLDVVRSHASEGRFTGICRKMRAALRYHADLLRDFEDRIGPVSRMRKGFEACSKGVVAIRTELAVLCLLRLAHSARPSTGFQSICDVDEGDAHEPPLDGCAPPAARHTGALLQAIFERVMCNELARAVQASCMALHKGASIFEEDPPRLCALDPLNPLFRDVARALLPAQPGVAARMATLRGVCPAFARHFYLQLFQPRAVPLGLLHTRSSSLLAETLVSGGLLVNSSANYPLITGRGTDFAQRPQGPGWAPEPAPEQDAAQLEAREAWIKADTTAKLPYVTLFAPFMQPEPPAAAAAFGGEPGPPELHELLRHFSAARLKELRLWDWAHGRVGIHRSGEEGRAYDSHSDELLGRLYGAISSPLNRDPHQHLAARRLQISRLLPRPAEGPLAPLFPCALFDETLARDADLVPDIELACSLYGDIDERTAPSRLQSRARKLSQYGLEMQPMLEHLDAVAMDRGQVFGTGADQTTRRRVFSSCFGRVGGYPNVSMLTALNAIGDICNTLRYVQGRVERKVPDDPNARALSYGERRLGQLRSASDAAKLQASMGIHDPHNARSLENLAKALKEQRDWDEHCALQALGSFCKQLDTCLRHAKRGQAKEEWLPWPLLHAQGVIRATAAHRVIEPCFYACDFREVIARRERRLVESFCDLSSVLGGGTVVSSTRLNLGRLGGEVVLRMSATSGVARMAVADRAECHAVQGALQRSADEDPEVGAPAVACRMARTGANSSEQPRGPALYLRRGAEGKLERVALELPPKSTRDGLLRVGLRTRPRDVRGAFNPFRAGDALGVSQRVLCLRQKRARE